MAPDPLLPLWSTPLGVHRFAQAAFLRLSPN